MKLCAWRSEWFGRDDVQACPAAATQGDLCPVHAREANEATEREYAIANRDRIARLYRREVAE